MSDQLARGFEVKSVPKAGAIGRLFGHVPREAAFVAVRNILATTPFKDVCARDITGALAKAKLHSRAVSRELVGILEEAALLLVGDGELDDSDRRGLVALQNAFELTDAEAAGAIESAVGQIFERALREALSDGIFTAEEKAHLELTSKRLGMSDAQTKRLYNEAASAALQGAFINAVADQRYTSDEEAYISELAESLGVKITHDTTTAALVERFKLLARIDDGVLPSVPVAILLKRAELCHFAGLATHHQIKSVTKRINYGGPTASIRIMKGVRWRLGSIAVQRVTTDVMTQLDAGRLYITSARLLFDGARKNVSIPFGKITNFTVFKDGLQVEKETGADQYFLGTADWELAGACLESAASRMRAASRPTD